MTTTTVTPAPTPARREPGWTELGIAIPAYLGLSVLLSLPLAALVPDAASSSATILMLACVAVATLGASALALLPRIRSLVPLRLRHPGVRWLLGGLAAGIGVVLVNRLVVIAWILITGDSSDPQQYLTDASTAGGWVLAATIALGGLLIPFAEELLFRGVAYSALRRYGVIVAILGSAALFGLAHGFSVVLVGALVLGVVNAWMVERSGSIWPAAIAHAVNNTILFVLAAVLLG